MMNTWAQYNNLFICCLVLCKSVVRLLSNSLLSGYDRKGTIVIGYTLSLEPSFKKHFSITFSIISCLYSYEFQLNRRNIFFHIKLKHKVQVTKRGIPWQNVVDILFECQCHLQRKVFEFLFDDKPLLLGELPFLKPLRNAIFKQKHDTKCTERSLCREPLIAWSKKKYIFR